MILLVPLCLCASSDSVTDHYTKANRAFASGQYAEAIRDYDAIMKKNVVSAPLLFNLANACFRDGKIGLAILNYERAQWLAPHDADIEANLRLIRKASGLFAPDLTWWQQLAHRFSMDVWTWMASLLFTLLCIMGVVRLLSKSAPWAGAINRNWWRGAMVILALGLLKSLACIIILAGELDDAIVVTAEVPLRISPYDTANSSGTLMTGEMVRVQKKYENFLHVRTQQGKTGWVDSQQIERIVR